MIPMTNSFDTSLSTLNTHVEEPGKEAELSRARSPFMFSEMIANILKEHGWGDVEAGYVLDEKVDDSKEKKCEGTDPFMVDYEPGDPENPKNWSKGYRWFLTIVSSIFVLNSTFASSSPSGIIVPMIEHFKLSQEVAILTLSLFVAGYCFGPLLWGPLSELYGRRPVFIIGFFGYTMFQIGDALAPNIASLLVFRFLGGAFAACPLTNSGALMADVWDVRTRSKALALFCIAPLAGPALAPAVGGYIAVSGVSWRWLYFTCACFAGLCLVIIMFFIPETHKPVILACKVERKQKETGDKRYFAAIQKHEVSLARCGKEILAKPFVVLMREPMLLAIAMYMAFMYGCLYLLFEAYPIVFEVGHHMNAGLSGLMFVPILVGAVAAVVVFLFYFEPIYIRKLDEYAPKPVPPEEHMRIAVWIGPMYAIAFFWFGWTSDAAISFWAPMMSGLLVGASTVLLFLSLINYTVDTYLAVSASALAAITIIRSVVGAAFPLFATQMFLNLTPRWASTVLGFIALVMAPIPTVLIRYGPYLRRKSKYAPSYV